MNGQSDTESIRMVRCPECGSLMAEGKPCRTCSLTNSTASDISTAPRHAASTSLPRPRRWLWVATAGVVIVAAVVVATVALSGGDDASSGKSYEEDFRTLTLGYAITSRELVPLLNDFGNWQAAELLRMRALAGILAETNAKARDLRPPVEASDAHAALMQAVYQYDLASQQIIAFVRAASAAGGFPDARGAIDASRSLIEADRARIQAQAMFVKVYGPGAGTD